MRRRVHWIATALLVCGTLCAYGQDVDPKAEIQQKLDAQFILTKTTADRSDTVTEGTVVVLQRDGLLMYSVSNLIPPQSTYKNGKIVRTPFVQRNFTAGEELWVTKVDVRDDGVVFRLYSDSYNNLRYWGELKFWFPKNSIPAANDLLKTIAEVLTIQSDDNADENASEQAPTQALEPAPVQASKPAPEPAPVQALAPIAPPPPPSDTPPPPKTISLGQTRDEVLANFGEPEKAVKLSTKETLYYPDMKVTLVEDKVTDVQ
jgi:hypothetical protein